MNTPGIIFPHIHNGAVQYFNRRNLPGFDVIRNDGEESEWKSFNLPNELAGGRKELYFNHVYSPKANACVVVEGQMDGQVFSGMSQALFEECLLDEGSILNPSPTDYRLPRPFELPAVERIIVEDNDPYGPFGAKEVGQGPIQCTTQAIANAVSNAIGFPINEMPITPERVLKALRQKKQP